MKMLKMHKYVSPSESEKWCNRDECREIYVNPEDVSYVEMKEHSYYGRGGFQDSEIVPTLHFKNGEAVPVVGTKRQVIDMLESC